MAIISVLELSFDGEDVQKYKKHTCNQCGRAYKYKSGLKQYQKYQCGLEKQFQCQYCTKLFSLKFHLKHHVIMKHKMFLD